MKLVLVGMNHRSAPVELREKCAFRPQEVNNALLRLQEEGADEALILSTCNRVELTATVDDRLAAEDLASVVMTEATGLDLASLRPHLYAYEDSEAVRHLFRVASSLDSMIVGEPQILGQLKQAYAQARDQGTVGRVLEAVVTRAFTVAKRVRTETAIGESAVSVSYAAVELARDIFGTLHRKRVLIVGAGKMSEATARHLLGAGVADILITNRTAERALELAALFRGDVIPYETLPQRLHEADIVITSSSSPAFVLSPEMVRRALELRKHQPMFLIDIAVPRNIDPAVNTVEGAFLYDIDDLERVAERNRQSRQGVAAQAEAIVIEEVARLQARLRERDVTPAILSLQEQLEAIRVDVTDRYRARLGPLTIQQEQALEALTRGIINKIAHGPISEMRRQAAAQANNEDAREGEVMGAVRRMFRLRDR